MTGFENKIETHQQNKREAFDGMRAYHQSEISHKSHAIDVLKTIMTAILTIYAGLVVSVVTGKLASIVIIVTSILVCLATAICGHAIVWATNKKIDQDNTKYEGFRDEYKTERRILCLEEELQKAGCASAWIQSQDRKKSGYSTTKLILNIFAWSLTFVATIATVFVFLIASTGNGV
ncbi:hypothetical protein [Methyloglobulus sp.]|uniref:hypothetical protein n=1 Tax=Methyloglobulus sp. TaxID=2518622 RepID=UPI0032B74091